MFTGIIQDVGEVSALQARGGDLRLQVSVHHLPLSRLSLGDSIAVAGTCLTVVEITVDSFLTDVSQETLRHTTLGSWRVGQRVNLEPALRAGDALGGHMVSGHVDGVAEILERSSEARSEYLRVRAPSALSRYIARKGSVTLDGVSLTVNALDSSDCFGINLVPHTLAVTTLGELKMADKVNLEIDLIARYTERLLKHE